MFDIWKKALTCIVYVVLIVTCWLCLQHNTAYSREKVAGISTPIQTIVSQSAVFQATPSPTSGTNSSPSTDVPSDIIQSVYVFLTLGIAVIAFLSFRSSTQQSKDTLIESRRQSQAAINAIQEQITQSENHHRELIYNQNRPIIVCDGPPPPDVNEIKYYMIKNVGIGVATDIRYLLSIRSSSDGSPRQAFFQMYSVLVPGSDDQADYSFNVLDTPYETVGGYSCFTEKSDPLHNHRFICTYRDIFNRVHLSIFDGITYRAWRQVELLADVKFELPEIPSRQDH